MKKLLLTPLLLMPPLQGAMEGSIRISDELAADIVRQPVHVPEEQPEAKNPQEETASLVDQGKAIASACAAALWRHPANPYNWPSIARETYSRTRAALRAQKATQKEPQQTPMPQSRMTEECAYALLHGDPLLPTNCIQCDKPTKAKRKQNYPGTPLKDFRVPTR